MKLAVYSKIPLEVKRNYDWFFDSLDWKKKDGLQICQEAQKLLDDRTEWSVYVNYLTKNAKDDYRRACAEATYEQRLEALCRVWWPEKW